MDRENTIKLAAPRRGGGVFSKLAEVPGVQLIYVSALACTRHRGNELVALQRQGVLSYLLLDEIDMITGDYIQKTKDAAAQVAEERNPTGIILITGCQSALLSTDYALLTGEIEQELGVPVRVHDGCRLCGFDEESPGASALDQLPYEFILPAQRSEEPSVNILGSGELDGNSELFAVLEAAGVKRINRLADCKSPAQYQQLGSAHLNIITSAQDRAIGQFLQEKLGIDWVCLGGIYDPGELEAAYRKLGEVFGADIDVSSHKNRVDEKLRAVKREAGGRAISVEGDPEMAKWLLREGFSVRQLRLNPHQSLTREQRGWFSENAADLQIESATRGAGGRPGGGGPGGGRGGQGEGGGRPGRGDQGAAPGGRGGPGMGRGRGGGGSVQLKIGYVASMEVLQSLEKSAGGSMR